MSFEEEILRDTKHNKLTNELFSKKLWVKMKNNRTILIIMTLTHDSYFFSFVIRYAVASNLIFVVEFIFQRERRSRWRKKIMTNVLIVRMPEFSTKHHHCFGIERTCLFQYGYARATTTTTTTTATAPSVQRVKNMRAHSNSIFLLFRFSSGGLFSFRLLLFFWF